MPRKKLATQDDVTTPEVILVPTSATAKITTIQPARAPKVRSTVTPIAVEPSVPIFNEPSLVRVAEQPITQPLTTVTDDPTTWSIDRLKAQLAALSEVLVQKEIQAQQLDQAQTVKQLASAWLELALITSGKETVLAENQQIIDVARAEVAANQLKSVSLTELSQSPIWGDVLIQFQHYNEGQTPDNAPPAEQVTVAQHRTQLLPTITSNSEEIKSPAITITKVVVLILAVVFLFAFQLFDYVVTNKPLATAAKAIATVTPTKGDPTQVVPTRTSMIATQLFSTSLPVPSSTSITIYPTAMSPYPTSSPVVAIDIPTIIEASATSSASVTIQATVTAQPIAVKPNQPAVTNTSAAVIIGVTPTWPKAVIGAPLKINSINYNHVATSGNDNNFSINSSVTTVFAVRSSKVDGFIWDSVAQAVGVHYGSGVCGSSSTVVMNGHHWPNGSRRGPGIFDKLPLAAIGDTITCNNSDNSSAYYKVTDKLLVNGNNTDYIQFRQDSKLVLVTCDLTGSSRYVIIAQLV